MRLELLKDSAELPTIRSAWQALCDDVHDTVTVFASFDWYETWWRHYSADASLNIVTLWDDGKLVGIAPLMLRRASIHGLPAKAVCFIGNSQSLNNDFIVLPAVREYFLREMLGYLFDHAAPWEILVLKNLPQTSANCRALAGILEESGKTWRQDETVIDSPYLVPAGSWEEYLASRSTRTRKGLRNIRNNMHKAGEVVVSNITTPAGFLSIEDEVFTVARQSWAERGGDSLASPGNEGFYHDLALCCAAKGWLSLWTLRLNGRMIAVEFHLRAYGREHAMRGHYLPEFAPLSPGTYLEMHILRNAFEEADRVAFYDLCGSFESYKRKWTDTSVPHCDITVFGDKAYARVIASHETKMVPLLKSVFPRNFWNHRLFKIFGINTNRLEIK